MTFWSDHHGIIYGVRTIRVYELIQDLPYLSKSTTGGSHHHNQAKTAGILFIYVCFNQFQDICKETTLPQLIAMLQSCNEVNKRLHLLRASYIHTG